MQPSSQQLHGKVALITGASSGIGREAARLFARHGARLVLTARRQPELQALVAEIEQDGGQAIALAGDVRDEPLARALVETATARFGGLDIAFNNAGMTGDPCALPDLSLQAWQEAIATNLTSAFLGAKHQIPALLARRRLADLHLHLRGLHGGPARHGCLCRQQGRPRRPHPGHRG